MKARSPTPRPSTFVALVALAFALAGCHSTPKAPSYYKTTLADPHPYPVQVIRTLQKPQKQSNGTYLLIDPSGAKLEIPVQFVKKIERDKPEPDKSQRNLYEAKPKEYKPNNAQFRGPFEFR